jgi:hypothetical protein
MVFAVVAADGGTAPDAPSGVLEHGAGGNGLKPTAEVEIVAEAARSGGGTKGGRQAGADGEGRGGGEAEEIAARVGRGGRVHFLA